MSTPTRQRESRLWTAVVQLKPKPGNDMLEGAVGAFVPVVALAVDTRDVVLKVRAKASTYGFRLCRIEDIAPLTQFSPSKISPELLRLARRLTPDSPVAFGTFHSYEEGS